VCRLAFCWSFYCGSTQRQPADLVMETYGVGEAAPDDRAMGTLLLADTARPVDMPRAASEVFAGLATATSVAEDSVAEDADSDDRQE